MNAARDRTDIRVSTLGLWHLGSVVSACLARLGYRVTGYDPDQKLVRNLAEGVPPLYEPGLSELISEELKSGRLTFTDDMGQALADAEFVLLTFDSPVDEEDNVDLRGIFATTSRMASHLGDGATVIVMSQVPVGTCEEIALMIQQARPKLAFGLVCSPENLKLGQAIDRFLQPPMLVLGSDDEDALAAAERLFSPIQTAKLRLDLRTAEMVKHALNAFSATCISFSNEIAALCEAVGVDATALAEVLHHDERVGAGTPIRPGLGFAGGTLARDLNVLRTLGDGCGLNTPLLDAVLTVNEDQKDRVLHKLQRLCGTLEGHTISVFGLTYKPGTSTLRRSVSLEVIASLVAQGSVVKAYDPRIDTRELPSKLPVDIGPDPYETVRGSDALLVMTQCPEFSTLDYAAIQRCMRQPVLLDATNMLDPHDLLKCGFRYQGMGR